jgi:regulator of protease activity HflC (stomatin/prohibitin superfamily)
VGERRIPMIERILHRVEDHVEQWRRQDAARKAEAASQRDELWAEAAERQKLLAEAISDEEAHPVSLEEMTKQQRVVFVLHREDLTGTLEAFASEKDRLINVVPGKGDYGSGRGIEGIRGSWLVFETPEQE